MLSPIATLAWLVKLCKFKKQGEQLYRSGSRNLDHTDKELPS